MLLSVIIPVYNTGAYLRDCLDVLVSQVGSGAHDVEVVCVDDGSADGSSGVLDSYAADHPYVRVLHKPNGGMSSARNAGLGLARGRWVMFVDHDDLVASGTIDLIRAASLLESDIVYLDFDDFTSVSDVAEPAGVTPQFVDISAQIGKLQEDCLNRFRTNRPEFVTMRLTTPWAKLYRREFLVGNGLRFREDVLHAEDLIFNLECLDRATTATRLDRVALHHRLLIRSEGHRYNPKKIDYCKGALGTLSEILPAFRNQRPDWETLYRYRLLWELMYCVYLGPFHPDNPHSFRVRQREFRDLLADPLFRNTFEQCDIGRFSWKHNTLAFCVKHRLTPLLNLSRRIRVL